MAELEKTIKGLECCVRDVRGKAIRTCDDCPYDNDGLEKPCQAGLMTDALTLLKEREPRVMTPDEIENSDFGYIEYYSETGESHNMEACVMDEDDCEKYIGVEVYQCGVYNLEVVCKRKEYNTKKGFRVWNKKPTSEMMANMPWEVKDARSSENNTPS